MRVVDGGSAGQPFIARLIGRLFQAGGNRKVGLQYDPTWLQQGFAPSEDHLPLARGVFLPKERDMAAGAVDGTACPGPQGPATPWRIREWKSRRRQKVGSGGGTAEVDKTFIGHNNN